MTERLVPRGADARFVGHSGMRMDEELIGGQNEQRGEGIGLF